ncbi:MAG: UvrD-helicase domain-containing protein [Chlorobi bacterium]|nr:UvrD-helicase domain-containing protein [Chlorobiota bacterium]
MLKLTSDQERAIDFTKHVFLTANAGSGKTAVLSYRYIEIALQADAQLSSIVAITFTEKAAGELYNKISKQIEERLAAEKNPAVRKKLIRIRRELVSANISTIHAFCLDLLKEFSPEAEIDANFQIADKNAASDLIRFSVEEVFNSIAEERNELTDEISDFLRYFGSSFMAKEKMISLIKDRKTALHIIDEIYSKSDKEIFSYLKEKIPAKLESAFPNLDEIIYNIKRINDFILSAKTDNAKALAAADILSELESASGIVEKINLVNRLTEFILTKSGTIAKTGYLKERQTFEAEVNAIEKFFKTAVNVRTEPDEDEIIKQQIDFARIALDVFDVCLSNYKKKKQSAGLLDYEDLLLKANEIIKRAEVREALNNKYRFIMIDEYQDTNEIQYDIVMPILENLRSGNLFVVGDEKQSIYRFRGAEPEVYEKTKKEIGETTSGESVLSLPHSFRVSPKIAFFVNKVFGNLFRDPNPEFNEVFYSDLISTRDDKETGEIAFLLTDKESGVSEAELVAKQILKLKEEKGEEFSFSDAAVLCRQRKHFAELENAFAQYGIPFMISGGKGFFQRQIIYDIYNYVSFLIDNEDDFALVGLLRSPFYLLSDSELFSISMRKGNSLYEKFKNYSAEKKRHETIVEKLDAHSSAAYFTDVNNLLRKILNETGYAAVVASKPNAPQEIANLEKIIQLAVEFPEAEFKNIFDFKEHLSESIDKSEDEGQADLKEESDIVHIMTIHKSKGLEFDAVFLFRANDPERKRTVKSKDIIFDKEFGVIAKVPKPGNYMAEYRSSLIDKLYGIVSAKKEEAENKRVLYVALTRAKNFLYVSGELNKNSGAAENSFLGYLQSGLFAEFDADKIKLGGKLRFMKDADEDYRKYEEEISFSVSIKREIEIDFSNGERKEESAPRSFENLIGAVEDSEKNEFISATKIAYFTQCPVKYKLTYEFGYSKLLKILGKAGGEYINKREDDDDYLPADMRGRIVHLILEKEIPRGKLKEFIDENLSGDENVLNSETRKSYAAEIIALVEKFYDSKIYSDLKNYSDFRNEYEIYSKEDDFYLYGIVDKFILHGDKIIIVDYKTDAVKPEEIPEKAKNYVPQLTFYAYILRKVYPDVKKFEIKLIFVQNPDEPFVKKFQREELESFGKELKYIVSSIREKRFEKNLSHCKKCHYADSKGNCPA